MTMGDQVYRARTIEFLSEYITYDDCSLFEQWDVISDKDILFLCQYLIDHGVFKDSNDLRRQALKDHNVLIQLPPL